jgi:hypothetical protein
LGIDELKGTLPSVGDFVALDFIRALSEPGSKPMARETGADPKIVGARQRHSATVLAGLILARASGSILASVEGCRFEIEEPNCNTEERHE